MDPPLGVPATAAIASRSLARAAKRSRGPSSPTRGTPAPKSRADRTSSRASSRSHLTSPCEMSAVAPDAASGAGRGRQPLHPADPEPRLPGRRVGRVCQHPVLPPEREPAAPAAHPADLRRLRPVLGDRRLEEAGLHHPAGLHRQPRRPPRPAQPTPRCSACAAVPGGAEPHGGRGRLGVHPRENTRGLVGRDWVCTAVQAFVQDPQRSSGYFVLSGEPGIGKSSIAAELVRRFGWVHHVNRRTAGIVTCATAWRNLASPAGSGSFSKPRPSAFPSRRPGTPSMATVAPGSAWTSSASTVWSRRAYGA